MGTPDSETMLEETVLGEKILEKFKSLGVHALSGLTNIKAHQLTNCRCSQSSGRKTAVYIPSIDETSLCP